MTSLRRSVLTAAILLVIARQGKSGKSGPPTGACRDDICVNDYRGDGTDLDLCQEKLRLVQYCPAKDELCLAETCKSRGKCLERGGYCTDNEEECKDKSVSGLCEGHGCFCCVDDAPIDITDEPGVSVCSDSGMLVLSPNEPSAVYSPNFPSLYSHDTYCALTVVSPANTKLLIEFVKFNLEDCNFDSLSINSQCVHQTFTGSLVPEPISLTDSYTVLTFQSDGSIAKSGFYLNLTALSLELDCTHTTVYNICEHNVIHTSTGGILTSPNYPDPYPSNQDCPVTLSAPAGNTIKFQYIQFKMEDYDCEYDYVTISDTRYCGSCPPSFTETLSNEVEVEFTSDDFVNMQGFAICFTVV